MTRDPLALAMLAAWLNVTPEQLPEKFHAHECDATMAAWQRVGEAAVAWVRAHPEAVS
jgi:hypothetical protein